MNQSHSRLACILILVDSHRINEPIFKEQLMVGLEFQDSSSLRTPPPRVTPPPRP